MKITAHRFAILQSIIVILMLIAAFSIEFFYNLIPCPICWIQRGICYVLIACFACEWRFGLKKWSTILIYGCLCSGLLLSLHHQYLIKHYDPSASCLPGFDYLYNTFGLFGSLKIILTDHSSSCGNATFDFLGLNLPAWLLVIYGLLFCLNITKQITYKRARAS